MLSKLLSRMSNSYVRHLNYHDTIHRGLLMELKFKSTTICECLLSIKHSIQHNAIKISKVEFPRRSSGLKWEIGYLHEMIKTIKRLVD